MVERSTYAHLTMPAKLQLRKRPEANSFKTMVEPHLIKAKTVETPFTRSQTHTQHANRSVYHQFQSNQKPSKRVPDLRFYLERKTGFEPATLTLAKKGEANGWPDSVSSLQQVLFRWLFR
jgi:hypothetical protein